MKKIVLFSVKNCTDSDMKLISDVLENDPRLADFTILLSKKTYKSQFIDTKQYDKLQES